MKRLLLSAGILVSVFTATVAQQRIPIQDEKPIEMYALGATGNNGVFKFNPADWGNPTKISGDAYIQYTGSSLGGGGTFLSGEEVVGVKYNYGSYPFEATADGTSEGPWTHSYFAYSSAINRVYDMTYDEKNNVIYCWYAVSGSVKALGIYDPAAHAITRVGSEPNVNIFALAIDNNGQLWGMGSEGVLYMVDRETGAAQDVTGFWGCGVPLQDGSPASAAVDPATNTMYVVCKGGLYNTYATLYKVDLDTHKGEKVSDLNKLYNCLYIAGSSINENAPAPVENLAATFDGEATVVTFTAPTKTAGGRNLTGELTYKINVDGTEVATGSVQAGAQASVNINPATGSHEIQVTVANSAGESKSSKTTVFSGYDEPTAVSDLVVEAEGDNVKLTWAAPIGKHGGLVDMTKITYTVSVDGTDVASGLDVTEYSCTLESFYALHTFSVSVVDDGTRAESVSATAMAGKPYDVPFTLDLAGFDTLGEAGVTLIDLDHRNSGKWELVKDGDETYLESYSEPVFTRTDFAYLPTMNLKAGATYTFTFKAAAQCKQQYGSEKLATLQVVLAGQPTGDAAAYTKLDEFSLTGKLKIYDWTEYSVNFTVEADGDYNLGIVDYAADAYVAFYYLGAKDFAVSVNYHTPKAVVDLTAEAEGEGRRNVALSFKLPAEDTDGEVLPGITKVEIFRGEDLIKTFEGDLTPGEDMSYTDEDAPRGIAEYKVVVFNGEQLSEAATVTATVGFANNLAIEILSVPEQAVDAEGEGKITVKVTSDGFEAVAAGAYDVVLMHAGDIIAKQEGTALAMDESAEFTFDLAWTGETPATVEYTVEVVFGADEDATDNATAPITVNYKEQSGLATTATGAITIGTKGNIICVRGACSVSIYTLGGSLVDGGVAQPEFVSKELPSGAYIVTADGISKKIVL